MEGNALSSSSVMGVYIQIEVLATSTNKKYTYDSLMQWIPLTLRLIWMLSRAIPYVTL